MVNTVEHIVLKYPFDIKKIEPKKTKTYSSNSYKEVNTYKVSWFSSVKYNNSILLKKLVKQYGEDYEINIYSDWATSYLKNGNTVVNKLIYTINVNEVTKKISVNLALSFDGKATVLIEEDVTEDISK